MPLQLNTDSNGNITQRFEKYLTEKGIKPESVSKYIKEWKIVHRDAFLSKETISKKEAKSLMTSYINLLVENKIAHSVIRRRLMVANRFFRFIRAYYTLEGVRLPKRPETKVKVISKRKFEKIKSILNEHPQRDFSDICNAVILTGLSLKQVLSLKFNRQDLNAKRLVVDGRIIVINDAAVKVLARRLVGSVKWSRGEFWYVKTLAETKLGVTFSTLRNMFAMESIAEGKPINFIMAQMGLRSSHKIKHIVASYMDYINDD